MIISCCLYLGHYLGPSTSEIKSIEFLRRTHMSFQGRFCKQIIDPTNSLHCKQKEHTIADLDQQGKLPLIIYHSLMTNSEFDI